MKLLVVALCFFSISAQAIETEKCPNSIHVMLSGFTQTSESAVQDMMDRVGRPDGAKTSYDFIKDLKTVDELFYFDRAVRGRECVYKGKDKKFEAWLTGSTRVGYIHNAKLEVNWQVTLNDGAKAIYRAYIPVESIEQKELVVDSNREAKLMFPGYTDYNNWGPYVFGIGLINKVTTDSIN